MLAMLKAVLEVMILKKRSIKIMPIETATLQQIAILHELATANTKQVLLTT